MTFQIRSSEKYLFGFDYSNYVVKTEFFKKRSRTSILAICYSNIQSYLKIDLILTMLFNVYFQYRKSCILGPLTMNCPKLDKNKSIVSSFLVFVVYKLAVSIAKKTTMWGVSISECLYLHLCLLIFQ